MANLPSLTNIEVYCDESHPDALTSDSTISSHLFLGSLWLAPTFRPKIKQDIASLKKKYTFRGEIKWNLISGAYVPFYQELVQLFFSYGSDVRFRALAVPHDRIRYDFNKDREHRFFVFYRVLLEKWLQPGLCYQLFLDQKTLHDSGRPSTLVQSLQGAAPNTVIKPVQSVDSSESVCAQLTDLLLGVVQARLNSQFPFNERSAAKRAVVGEVERHLGRAVAATSMNEPKFNVFKMDRI